jgi:hypothetical protein
MIHTRLHMRTGDEIREAWEKSFALWACGENSYDQFTWTLTYLTLPPSASDLEEAA